ncbi:MAG: hypothetical protein AAFX81_01690 [Pseudomonadota bacterium]
MTRAIDKITLLMTLSRQLTQIMNAETDMLRRVELADLTDVQAEKQALADVYEIELRELRQQPELLGSASSVLRHELELSVREFQAAARRNALALQAAHTVVERVLVMIGRSLDARPGYGAAAPGHKGAEIVPFALDRQC